MANNKVFSFLNSKGNKPSKHPLKMTRSSKVEEAAPAEDTGEGQRTQEEQITNLLFQYELAEKAKRKIQEVNAEVFAKLDQVSEDQDNIRNEIRRLLHTKDGPPDAVKPGRATHVWATGELFKVSVTYKRNGNYYDPKKLPLSIFAFPGVVKEVDKSKLDEMAKTDGRVATALVHGTWATPAVTIAKVTKDPEDE